MKRNEKKVPGFDEIIFRNRNKEYGAYDLRRRYKTTASLSALSVSAFFILLTMLIFSLMPKAASAGPDHVIYISVTPDEYTNPREIAPLEPKKPVIQSVQVKYSPPVITDDPALLTNTLMSNDLATTLVQNGSVIANPDSEMKYIAPEPVRPEEIFVSSQEPPIFPGGVPALMKYIADNTKYPEEAIEINLQGKVIVKFAVMSDGAVSRIDIIRGVGPLLDKEAARVVSTLPQWRPGKQNGVPVSVWFAVPVSFELK
jgi:protein TonB